MQWSQLEFELDTLFPPSASVYTMCTSKCVCIIYSEWAGSVMDSSLGWEMREQSLNSSQVHYNHLCIDNWYEWYESNTFSPAKG